MNIETQIIPFCPQCKNHTKSEDHKACQVPEYTLGSKVLRLPFKKQLNNYFMSFALITLSLYIFSENASPFWGITLLVIAIVNIIRIFTANTFVYRFEDDYFYLKMGEFTLEGKWSDNPIFFFYPNPNITERLYYIPQSDTTGASYFDRQSRVDPTHRYILFDFYEYSRMMGNIGIYQAEHVPYFEKFPELGQNFSLLNPGYNELNIFPEFWNNVLAKERMFIIVNNEPMRDEITRDRVRIIDPLSFDSDKLMTSINENLTSYANIEITMRLPQQSISFKFKSKQIDVDFIKARVVVEKTLTFDFGSYFTYNKENQILHIQNKNTPVKVDLEIDSEESLLIRFLQHMMFNLEIT